MAAQFLDVRADTTPHDNRVMYSANILSSKPRFSASAYSYFGQDNSNIPQMYEVNRIPSQKRAGIDMEAAGMTTVSGDVQGETKAASIGGTPVSTAAHVRQAGGAPRPQSGSAENLV